MLNINSNFYTSANFGDQKQLVRSRHFALYIKKIYQVCPFNKNRTYPDSQHEIIFTHYNIVFLLFEQLFEVLITQISKARVSNKDITEKVCKN